MESSDLIDITCPRCHESRQERFYGPCAQCRKSLGGQMAGEKRSVEAAEYEPKMNVVPNQVATKE